MRFSDSGLQGALEQWRSETNVERRAEADNFWFEMRVSATRQNAFEKEAAGASGSGALRRRQIDYWQEHVKVDEATPHTFAANLDPADLAPIDEMQKVVRIESLVRPLNKIPELTFQRLKAALESNEADVLDKFVRVWNESSVRDWRPTFAAFKDEVLSELAEPDWPCRMRNRLGLAHYDCRDGPIPVALMEYPLRDVGDAARAAGISCAFVAPTVLDTGPWPYFFPAPPKTPYGRTMALFEVADVRQLLAELLHYRVTYRRDHIVAVGEIRTAPESFDLSALRNHHLLALRLESRCYDFGEEIAE